MKTLFKVALVMLGLWFGNKVLLAMFSPSGVWIRQVVREHPLENPMKVDEVDGLTLSAAGRTYQIGGISLPSQPSEVSALNEFVRVAVAQGIEIDETADLPSGASIRCEPRIWHWCGNDPVAAHFQQMNLNEIIVALGYAPIAPEVVNLASPAALRLRSAAKFAEEGHNEEERSHSLKHGINISAIMSVESAIQMHAYELRVRSK